MVPLEIIALVVIIVAAIKMIVLLVKPVNWLNFAKSFYKNELFAKCISFILAIIVFYYLIEAGMTMVQILAVTAFVTAMLMLGLAGELEFFFKKYEKLIKKGNLWKEYWLYTLIWVFLLALGVYELFFI